MPALLVVHVPPETEFANVVVNDPQTLVIPDIAAGIRFTVIGIVELQPPGMV